MLNEESFVDELIIEKHIDIKNKKISLHLNGCCLNDGRYINKIIITIENWNKIHIIQEWQQNTEELSMENINSLSSILKFNCYKNKLILFDVGNKCWIKFIFDSPTVEVYSEN